MDSSQGGGIGALLIFIIIAYFIPTVIAVLRKHKDGPAIFAVNLFFGWSVVGWFIAFIWALSDPRGRGNQTVVVNTTQHIGHAYPPYPPQPAHQPIARSTPDRLPQAAPAPALTSQDADTAFWDGMNDKNDPDLLEEYLFRFPAGRFSGLAGDRLKRAGRGPPPAEPPPEPPRVLLGPPDSALPSETVASSPLSPCPRCGGALEPQSRFCGDCGAPIEESAGV
jgi:Superinfection immunity protein